MLLDKFRKVVQAASNGQGHESEAQGKADVA